MYFYTAGNEFWKAYRNEGKAAGPTDDLSGDKVPDAHHPVGNVIHTPPGPTASGSSTASASATRPA